MIMPTIKKGVLSHSYKQVCVSKPLDGIASVRHSSQGNLRIECIDNACLKPDKCNSIRLLGSHSVGISLGFNRDLTQKVSIIMPLSEICILEK